MSGPKVLKVAIGIDATAEQIGGAQIASEVTGQAHHMGDGDAATLLAVRRYLSYFPQSCDAWPLRAVARPAIGDSPHGAAERIALVPDNQRRACSARRLLELVADETTTRCNWPVC